MPKSVAMCSRSFTHSVPHTLLIVCKMHRTHGAVVFASKPTMSSRSAKLVSRGFVLAMTARSASLHIVVCANRSSGGMAYRKNRVTWPMQWSLYPSFEQCRATERHDAPLSSNCTH